MTVNQGFTPMTRSMFTKFEHIEGYYGYRDGSYIVPVKNMEHAADHLIGLVEKFHFHEDILLHVEEILHSLNIPYPEID